MPSSDASAPVSEALRLASSRLERAGIVDAIVDAELLLGHVLALSRVPQMHTFSIS